MSQTKLRAQIRSVQLLRERVDSFDVYPFSIPAVRTLTELPFHPAVTFLIGENGSGKSTLIEAIAVALGFNAEGGSRNFRFSTRSSESRLHEHIQMVRGTRAFRTGYFLRAESFFNVATNIEDLDRDPNGGPPIVSSYGGEYLHDKSHGEAFLALVRHRFGPEGLYILDEPEAALSPTRQLALLTSMHSLCNDGCQFIIATHSPILMSYPEATIYQLSSTGIDSVEYESTEHFRLTRDFLVNRDRYFAELFKPDA